jgi:hypothetical protein
MTRRDAVNIMLMRFQANTLCSCKRPLRNTCELRLTSAPLIVTATFEKWYLKNDITPANRFAQWPTSFEREPGARVDGRPDAVARTNWSGNLFQASRHFHSATSDCTELLRATSTADSAPDAAAAGASCSPSDVCQQPSQLLHRRNERRNQMTATSTCQLATSAERGRSTMKVLSSSVRRAPQLHVAATSCDGLRRTATSCDGRRSPRSSLHVWRFRVRE